MKWKKKLATCAALVTLSALIMHVINKFIYFIATLENLLSKTEGEYYEWRFGKIFYKKQGEGEPLLLIHSLTSGSSGYEWHKLADELARTNTVYTVDLLGCGKSDKPNLTYTNFLYVQLITDFIKHIIGSKTNIIASGESGSFSLMACKNDDTIINKIMLINPSDLTELAKIPTKRTKVLRFLIYIPILGTLLYNILNTKHSIEETFLNDYYYDAAKIEDKTIRTYYECSHTLNPRPKYLFASLKGRYTNANILHCLKSIDNSVFILIGCGNPINREIAEQYHSYMPSIETVSIAKSKTLPHLECPLDVYEQINVLFEL